MVNDPIVVQCLHAVREHPRHALAGCWKRQLWQRLGNAQQDSLHPQLESSGIVRRFELAKRAVLHVLPLWKSMLPSDQLPLELLATGERFLAGSITVDDAKHAYDAGWVHADQVCGELYDSGMDNLWVGFVGYAAC